MRFDLKSKDATLDLVLTLNRQFPDRLVELRRFCNNAKNGVSMDLLRTKEWHTRKQENFYRNRCRDFALWLNLTETELHHILLCKCFGSEEVQTKVGPRVRPLERSRTASKTKFGELIDTLMAMSKEMGYRISPLPAELET